MLLDRSELPTALVACNDLLSLGAMRAVQEALIEMNGASEGFDLDMSFRDVPGGPMYYSNYRVDTESSDQESLEQTLLMPILFVSLWPFFMASMYNVARERNSNLRQTMRSMGLHTGSYFSSFMFLEMIWAIPATLIGTKRNTQC